MLVFLLPRASFYIRKKILSYFLVWRACVLWHKVEVRGHPAGVSSVRHMTPRDKLGLSGLAASVAPLSQGLVLTFRGNGFSSFVTCALDGFLPWRAVVWGLGGDAVPSACSALMLWCSKGKHQQTLGPGCLPCKGPSPSVRFVAPRFRSVVFHFQWCSEWSPGVSTSQMLP